MPKCYTFIDANARWLPAATNSRENGDCIIAIFFDPSLDLLETWAQISTKIFTLNRCSASEIFFVLEKIIRDFGVPAVICETDRFILDVSEACQKASIPFSSYSSVLNARNKYQTRRLTSECSNLYAKQTYSINDLLLLADTIGYPCILKPAAGTGSCLAYPAYNHAHVEWYVEEVRHNLERLGKDSQWFAQFGWICETLVKGAMVTAFVAADGVNIKTFAIARNMKQELSECIGFGSITPIISGDKLSVVQVFAEAKCRNIGLDYGVFDVEIILTEDGPELVEINPRPPGGQMLSALSLATKSDVFGFILGIYSGCESALNHPIFDKEVLIWKIMPAKNGTLKDDIEYALRSVIPRDVQYHYHPLPHEINVRQLDCLARVLFPCDSGEKLFALLRNFTIELSRLIGVELLFGELSAEW